MTLKFGLPGAPSDASRGPRHNCSAGLVTTLPVCCVCEAGTEVEAEDKFAVRRSESGSVCAG